MDRVLAVPEYAQGFRAAFPALGTDRPTVVHLAEAIAAFEATAFAFTDTPWDRYLRGDLGAMNEAAKLAL